MTTFSVSKLANHDHVQTSGKISNGIANDSLWLLIMPTLGPIPTYLNVCVCERERERDRETTNK